MIKKQTIFKHLIPLTLSALILFSNLLHPKDKNPTKKFNDAERNLITKVRELINEDRAKAFKEYAKGAQVLAVKFPNEIGPLMMMAEASGLIEDKELSAKLTDKAETGILAFIKKDIKNPEANAALLQMAGNTSSEKAKIWLTQIASNGPPEIANQAKGKLWQLSDPIGKPLHIKFNAVDGRKVDLTKMKGKVVLIDFWATWCGPCVDELPNVKKTYAKYHKKRFEIIGISLDQSKEELIKFVEKEKMPWLQYFDGLGWKNEFAVKYGIQGIPAMWLVDKKGNLVDMKARANLDGKVEKLLKE